MTKPNAETPLLHQLTATGLQQLLTGVQHLANGRRVAEDLEISSSDDDETTGLVDNNVLETGERTNMGVAPEQVLAVSQPTALQQSQLKPLTMRKAAEKNCWRWLNLMVWLKRCLKQA